MRWARHTCYDPVVVGGDNMQARMPESVISASRLIHAPAARVYAILADYREGHPRILPEHRFTNFVVESGGVGAGTVVAFDMRVLGRRQRFRATVSEPEPGAVLVETSDNGAVTTFTVAAEEGGDSCEVTIDTRIDTRRGPLGRLEAWLASRMLLPIYEEELELLGAVAASSD